MKTEFLIIGAAALLIFGRPLLDALAGNGGQPIMGAVLDPDGPTRVPLGTVVPTPTPEPVFSTQVVQGDVVSNDFTPYGPDVSTVDVVVDAAGTGFGFTNFVFNPVGSAVGASIDGILGLFGGDDC